MRLTKYAQACIVLTEGDRSVLIDPTPMEPTVAELLAAADAVLVTHAHRDHADPEMLAAALASRPNLTVCAPADAAREVLDAAPNGEAGLAGTLIFVAPGDKFEAGGFAVAAFGGRHAVIHPEFDTGENVAYLVDGRVYHPGDSFDVPGVPVEVLLMPTSGPWHSTGQAIDFVRAVAPQRAIQIHELFASEIAQRSLATRIAPGASADVQLELVPNGQQIEL